MIQNIKIYLSKNNKYKNIVSIIFQKKKKVAIILVPIGKCKTDSESIKLQLKPTGF